MALAHVACLLAERLGTSDRVLVVDWDLEAPGRHRFFPPRLELSTAGTDLGLDAVPGLIDLFGALRDALPSQRAASEDAADSDLDAALEAVGLEQFFADTGVPGVNILRAGRNDDGQYSRRVGTFDWENLFHRCPAVFRRLAERLGAIFRYVLIDSRTGVTDISGICTSLLPEKLVFVLTPNRQSLTGMWDLVGRVTAYRRNSDDLCPLLVYPLPSRIEASRQDLRSLWRHGNPDKGIVGYQPMFEQLFTTTYGLRECDLSAYFDDVQIQQTADYAYGEEIAVRRSSDRFSLANSYRVLADQLKSGRPPWARDLEEPAPPRSPAPAPSTPTPNAPPPPAPSAASPPPPSPAPLPAPSVSPGAPPPRERRPMAFLSYASEDREAAARIVVALQQQGIEVWDTARLTPGASWGRAIEEALDRSDAVVACWSQSSVVSKHVLEEAGEGLRRGVLIPVLLDDVAPPLAFRSIQGADLRRDFDRGVGEVARAVTQVARSAPGLPSSVPPATPATRPTAAALALRALAVAELGVLGLWAAWSLRGGSNAQPGPSPTTVAVFPAPNFVGSSAAEAQKAGDLLGLKLSFRDENGTGLQSSSVDGVVARQLPVASAQVSRGTVVELTVATATTIVPTVVGTTLDAAVAILEKAGLRLGAPESRPVRDARPGTILAQSPAPGTKVASTWRFQSAAGGRSCRRPGWPGGRGRGRRCAPRPGAAPRPAPSTHSPARGSPSPGASSRWTPGTRCGRTRSSTSTRARSWTSGTASSPPPTASRPPPSSRPGGRSFPGSSSCTTT
jgi:hypothetical protein